MHLLRQLASVASGVRHAGGVLERALPLLADTLAARGVALALRRAVGRRAPEYHWGAQGPQLVELARELAANLEAPASATARRVVLPGSGGTSGAEGLLLAAPLRGWQQALGVVVAFCAPPPPATLEAQLAWLEAAGTLLGLYVQNADLQAQLKAAPPEPAAPSSPTAYDPDQIIGQSPVMRQVLREVEQAARSRSTVLLRGESGTGKELIARALHRLSPRREQPFVTLNCAALPESLLESELFGHERGAFTGAVKMRRGRFELADKGTLFLDEIGDIGPAVQVKLLRVLQERTFERVGGNRPIHVDVRIIAATNTDLEEAVRMRRFREDLYYRLNVVPIVLPPLRQRREDIPLLVGHFLQRFNAENHKEVKISSAAMELIVSYDWPGNVRELENCIERMVVMARRDIIAPEDVPLPAPGFATPAARPNPPADAASLPQAVADVERQRLLEALRRCGGVQTRAATLLGITPRQLGYRLRKYGIDPRLVLG
ncbi:MAG: hypothetical protein KatS3mg131_3178 [Candidatus Tectimicrobiota bacterium]|nr:MAG: hypothetical protein KatS3mg131_3178 [Candidatus Tectomicrobia bacterium]